MKHDSSRISEEAECPAEFLLARLGDVSSEKGQAMVEKERIKPMRAPVLLIAAAEYPHHSNVLEIENVEAVAATVQNMLLAAKELGLAEIWHTGDGSYDSRVPGYPVSGAAPGLLPAKNDLAGLGSVKKRNDSAGCAGDSNSGTSVPALFPSPHRRRRQKKET